METVNSKFPDVIKFITKYREMEKSTYGFGFEIISRFADNKSQAAHIQNEWHSKKKGFGQFFLNKSHEHRIALVKLFGIRDPAGEAFLAKEFESEIDRVFAKPEGFSVWATQLLVYFENHGINEQVAPGVFIDKLPAMRLRYGNSANWGDFILKEPRRDEILTAIFNN